MDNISVWAIPICLLALPIGYFCSLLRRWWIGLLASIFATGAMAYFAVVLFDLLTRPANPEPSGGWLIIGAIYCSTIAIPTAVMAMFVARSIRAKNARVI